LVWLITAVFFISLLVYILLESDIAAWLLLGFGFSLVFKLSCIFFLYGYNKFTSLLSFGFMAVWIGAASTAIIQIGLRFSEEEYFAFFTSIVLAILWILIVGITSIMIKVLDLKRISNRHIAKIRIPLIFLFMIITIVGVIKTVHSYQNSFFPYQAPKFHGITAESPYLCDVVPEASEVYDSHDVYLNLLSLTEANPYIGSPEYAQLALNTQDIHWVNLFKESILDEAQQGIFTEPANSIKSSQYLAALRVYYFQKMTESFEDIFNSNEKDLLYQWFDQINRRAQTVEWVDYLYALAFSKIPEGPYENQEIGAGLLSILETYGLADLNFSMQNKKYLSINQLGWLKRFRNTDDTYLYQSSWIDNAFFQSQYFDRIDETRMHNSFEWLLLQAIPDGTPLSYNHPARLSIADLMYLGAILTNDSRYIWLSGRMSDYIKSNGKYLQAQPGLEYPIDLVGYSPSQGTCLLFGDSGLPNQKGPIAPDKIVFRESWETDSKYLLLNLRFTGWHRYKATNTIPLIYKNGPIIIEKTEEDSFNWLPSGRGLFRDKRIPRENLNGLLVEKMGLSSVLYKLTGIGGPWAQDPPYYANIKEFSLGFDFDKSTTIIENWNGWAQYRSIFFYTNGPIIIVDQIERKDLVTKPGTAAIAWHIPNRINIKESVDHSNRFIIREGLYPVEMILLPVNSKSNEHDIAITDAENFNSNKDINHSTSDVLIKTNTNELFLISVFLPDDWVNANIVVDQSNQEKILIINKGPDQIELVLPSFEVSK
jgi:hypothetical protein